ncbi:helix-turn-helix domain-containing protein [Sandarakinorhabdus oryzae]|uniref:helix-turn-helix domain-containing protein n=1 Tax=Sandarakinorhabdus oryzae TaxID=2675220 RepID=UPI0012E1CD69|nr:AraC family transcriptional regulator [Sandarakinorhabdus oryzae]
MYITLPGYDSYADYLGERARGGLTTLDSRRDLGRGSALFLINAATPIDDPPVPEITVQLLTKGRVDYRADFGEGRFAGVKRVGQFDVTPPDTFCRFEGRGTPELLILSVPWVEVSSLADQAGLPARRSLGKLHSRMWQCSLVDSALRQAWDHAADGGPVSRLFVQAAVDAVLARLFVLEDQATEAQVQRATGGLAPWKLRRVIERIDQDLSEELSIAALAEMCQLSPFHFARAFKSSTGKSPHAFIIERRLGLAARLLIETPLSITEISLAVGWNGSSNFAKMFRRAFGRTPSEFRSLR